MVVPSERERLPSMAFLGVVMLCLSCVKPSSSFKNVIQRFTPIEPDTLSSIYGDFNFGPYPAQMWFDTTADFTWLSCSNSSLVDTYHTWKSTTHWNVSCDSETCRSFYRNKQQKKPPCLPDNLCRYNFTYKYEAMDAIPEPSANMSGWLITDELHIPLANDNWDIQDFVFLCVYDIKLSRKVPLLGDGRIGLARGNFSLTKQVDDFLKKESSDRPFHQAFRINQCKGGYFFVGEETKDPDNTGTVKMLQSNLTTRESYYYIDMKNISVAGNEVVKGKAALRFPLNTTDGHGGVVMDSNLYFTRLASDVYVSVRDAFRQEIYNLTKMKPRSSLNGTFDTCYRFPKRENQSYTIPSVSFNFEEFDLTLSQIQTLYSSQNTSGLACLAFLRSDKDFSSLGVYQLRHMYVNYDDDAKKLKLSPNHCKDEDDNGSSFSYFPPYLLLLAFLECYVFYQMYIP